MIKPLKKLMPSAIVLGDLQPLYSNTPEYDEKGNLKPVIRVGKAELTIKVLDNQPQYRATYGIVGNRLMVECHLVKTWVKSGEDFIFMNLHPNDFLGSLKNESLTLTIISTGQYNLKPLTKIMGKKFTAIMDGVLPV